MKRLTSSLAAVLSVVLGSGTLAAAEDGLQKGANIFFGTVVSDPSLKDRYLAVAGGKDRWRFRTDTGATETAWLPNVYHPKVGERVRVYYHFCGRLDLCADKIEKVGKAEGGSKKR
jgi:hypothetical protein